MGQPDKSVYNVPGQLQAQVDPDGVTTLKRILELSGFGSRLVEPGDFLKIKKLQIPRVGF
jgi:hypothetical protein